MTDVKLLQKIASKFIIRDDNYVNTISEEGIEVLAELIKSERSDPTPEKIDGIEVYLTVGAWTNYDHFGELDYSYSTPIYKMY